VARAGVSREGIEVHRFNPVAVVFTCILAVLLQASIPLRLRWFGMFDLPLLVAIFFSVARRNPMFGTLLGCVLGVAQDGLTYLPIGLFGIAKTVVGYAASSIGVKVDVENPGSRLLMTFGFYLLHRGIYQWVGAGMARVPGLEFHWGHELGAALANSLLAVVLFAALDKLKVRR
jgi:rod shape-determining protein MreD